MHCLQIISLLFLMSPAPTQDRPMPDVNDIVTRVRANQGALEQLREKYTYTETTKEYERDGKGELKELSDKTQEVTSYRNQRLYRLTAKNGKPLSAEDQAKEDRRLAKLIAEIDAGKREYNQQALTVLEFLQTAHFSNLRREQYRGREVLALDIIPDPTSKTTNAKEKFLRLLAGTIRIDEEDLQMTRAELRLTGTFSGLGPLYKLRPGTEWIIEQARVNNEIWLPSYREETQVQRLMMMKTYITVTKKTFSDYKRFGVESKEGKDKTPVVPH
jgi:hypothetical protein